MQQYIILSIQAWEQMAAAGLVVMAPIFFLAMFIRKNVVDGLTMGAVK